MIGDDSNGKTSSEDKTWQSLEMGVFTEHHQNWAGTYGGRESHRPHVVYPSHVVGLIQLIPSLWSS